MIGNGGWGYAADETPARGALLASLHEQAAFLYRNVETYLLNNHVLENARALILAGCWLGDQGEAPRWLAKGVELLREHGAAQVLPDGGHFERSVMYHSLMLETWLDVLNVLPPEHPDAGAWSETAGAMMDFLASLLHPDGDIALFNDAAHRIAPSPERLLAYGRELLGREPRTCDEFPDSGYFVHRGPEVFLAMDAGPVGPDVSPGHGHADVFSYELSLKGRRIVVDRGTHEYAAGAMRDADRATRSHNTACIDGRDQVEFWASFRVARRDAPRGVRFVRGEGGCSLEGVFDGWGRLLGDGLEHRRVLSADDAARCITVEDRVSGRGRHLIESLVHLHPEASAAVDGRSVAIRRDEVACRIEVTEGGEPSLESSLYCPEFGRALPGTAVVLRHDGPLPVTLSYRILY